jgi:CubicO group peptidase (beta-lactamase class C family)
VQPVPIEGTCEPGFSAVRREFTRNFEARGDLGAAVCAYVDGHPVVDLWGGYRDSARVQPWTENTIACVASSGKGPAAVCLLRLVERGLVKLDEPVATYWPEFAQQGKEVIPVRWLLSHRAGLPAVRRDMTIESLYEWTPFVQALAEETPWWKPGTQHGYHALTFGFLVGEVVRRVSGHSIGSCLRTEVAARLNADIYFGVPQSEEARVAEIQPESPPSAGTTSLWTELLKDPTSMGARAFFNPPRPPQGMNTRAWRAAEIPASNAHASARGLARLYAGLARGGSLDGVSILDAEVIEQAVVEQSIGPDAVIRMQSRFGLGFWLPTPAAPYGSRRRAFGHPGRGGSVGFADPESRVGFGYVPNQYRGTSLDEQDPRATALIDAVYESLGSARLQRA